MNRTPGFQTLESYSKQFPHVGPSSLNTKAKQPLFPVPSTSNKQSIVPGPSTTSTTNEMKRSLSNVSANIATAARNKIVATEQSVPQKTSFKIASLRILTCPIYKVIQLQKSYPNLFVLYEVFASVIKLDDGQYTRELVIVLRHNNSGPVLRALYYDTDFLFPRDVKVGSFVRCIGRFSAQQRFHLLKINVQQQDCAEFVQRLETLTNFELRNSLLLTQYIDKV